MRMDGTDPARNQWLPWVNGQPVFRCLWADEEEGVAEVQILNRGSYLRDPLTGEVATYLIHGRVELRPKPSTPAEYLEQLVREDLLPRVMAWMRAAPARRRIVKKRRRR